MLHKKNLGLAGGIIWGLAMFIVTVISVYTGYAGDFLALIVSIYPGYSVSLSGSVVGLVYGFLDAFVGLYIFGWLYNLLEK
jgi:hypothetical protein